jgi:2-hydroxymuconate-semialdehyde hydrolase
MIAETPERGFVKVDGYRLGFARAGRGRSITLLHGIPTYGHLWRNVTPLLVGAGLDVLTIDLLGYGASDKPVGVDLGIAAQADFVAEAFDQLNWPAGTIVGHDIGGGVAQLLAVKKPDVVSRLILIDTIAYDSFPEPGIARLKDPVWDGILGAPDFDLKKGLTKGFMRGMVHSERVTPELIAAYERPFREVDGRLAYLRAARALRTEELVSQMTAVERLKTPTLIIWGAEDRFQPLQNGERLAKAMPNAQLEVVERAGHFLPEDAPETLAQLIANSVKAESAQP